MLIREEPCRSRRFWRQWWSWGCFPPWRARRHSRAPSLSEQDRADIRDLVGRYARALGSCAAEEYAALFTPDATFTSDDFRGKKHREMYGKQATLKGRDQLAELVRTEEFCLDGKPRAAGGGNRPAPTV